MDHRVRVLNLGAGNDSTALLIGSGEGEFDRVDCAIFSDTGWEPKRVYEHLTALQQISEQYGIPIHLASRGRLQDDVLDRRVFATLPAWTLGDDGKRGRIIRQCTPKYKVEPIEQKLREICGARVWHVPCRYCNATGERVAPWDIEAGPGPCSVCRGTGQQRRVGSVPKGTHVEQWIGFAKDEFERATTVGFPKWVTPRFPLIEKGWTKNDAKQYLESRGWTGVKKSSCLGCPFHDEDTWLDIADNQPDEFAGLVEFDRAFRIAPGLRAERYLHEWRMPLDHAVAQYRAIKEERGEQLVLFDEYRRKRKVRSCNPFGCRIEEMDDPVPAIEEEAS
jgi:hypothetical protein